MSIGSAAGISISFGVVSKDHKQMTAVPTSAYFLGHV